MPQASDELREITAWITGLPIDSVPDPSVVEKFLTNRGWRLTSNWEWVRPGNSFLNEKDELCIRYLIEEWDYGGEEWDYGGVAQK